MKGMDEVYDFRESLGQLQTRASPFVERVLGEITRAGLGYYVCGLKSGFQATRS